jgi:hypothetical protein
VAHWAAEYQDRDLLFAREDGSPIRPERVLCRFRLLTEAAGLPKVRVHDLRHLAASMMIAAGVPLPIVSQTLRHSTVSITADTYTHMTAEVALAAVDAMADALAAAEAEAEATRRARAALAEPAPQTPASTTESLAHSHRAHNEELITDQDDYQRSSGTGRG